MLTISVWGSKMETIFSGGWYGLSLQIHGDGPDRQPVGSTVKNVPTALLPNPSVPKYPERKGGRPKYMQAVFSIPYGVCRDQEKIRVHSFPISSVFGVHDRQVPAL